MLDANACILLLTGQEGLVTRAGACDAGDLVISAVAFAEVAVGSRNGKMPAATVLETLSRRIPVLPFDEAAAHLYATLPFRRGSYDRLIGAHASALGLILVTANRSDFDDVPGLAVEDWSRPL